MTLRKALGYIFIIIAIFLTLMIVGRLPALFRAIFGFFKIFTGSLNAGQVGFVIGSLLFWIAHIAITIILFKSGRKRIKKDVNQDETN